MRDKLIEKIKALMEEKKPSFATRDNILEIIDLIKQNEIEEKLVNDLLLELYKYVLFCHVSISVDPRGSIALKTYPIAGIIEELREKRFPEEDLKELKRVNEVSLSYFLDPLKMDKEMEEFYSKNPDIKF